MKGHCYYCERPFNIKILPGEVSDNPLRDKTKDHIIPRCKGGSNGAINILDSCYQCNRFKADHTPEEFVALLQMKLEAKKHGLYTRGQIERVLKNAQLLVKRVEKIGRHNLIRPGYQDIQKAIQVRLKHSPANLQQQRSQEDFLKKLIKKHPYVYRLLTEQNDDLPRWIFDNLVKEKK